MVSRCMPQVEFHVVWSFEHGTIIARHVPWDNGSEAVLMGYCLRAWGNNHYPNAMRQWLFGIDDYPIVMRKNGHEAQWIWV